MKVIHSTDSLDWKEGKLTKLSLVKFPMPSRLKYGSDWKVLPLNFLNSGTPVMTRTPGGFDVQG